MSTAADQNSPSQEAHELTERTLKWLASLEERLRPVALPQRYPRIANRIALLWPEPELMRTYFDEITVDERGDRAGFPDDVVMEIGTLRHYYDAQLHPIKTDVWYKILSQIYD